MKKLIKSKLGATLVITSISMIIGGIALSQYPKQSEYVLPKGNWSFSAHPYQGPDLQDRSVIVVSVETARDKGAGISKIRIHNKSSKVVTAFKLKWELFSGDMSENALFYEISDWMEPSKNILAGAVGTIVFTKPFTTFVAVSRPLLKGGSLDGNFSLTVSVTEAKYEDGSTWIAARIEKGYRRSSLKNVAFTKTPSQTGCAKQKCDLASGQSTYSCEASMRSEYCTNNVTSCTNTICGYKSCLSQDDCAPWEVCFEGFCSS